MGIVPEEGRAKAAKALHDDLVAREYRFTTGNLCTRYMMDALTQWGYLEDAWTLITRETYPSWGFMLQNEATTVWERFELKKNPGMNSHNHPMFGAVGYWFYAYLAGVKPLEAGWQRVAIHPYMPKNLLSAQATVAGRGLPALGKALRRGAPVCADCLRRAGGCDAAAGHAKRFRRIPPFHLAAGCRIKQMCRGWIASSPAKF